MNYEGVRSFLQERDLTMVRYERDGYDAFLKKTGFTLQVPFVHIAGSNGKSSVAHYLENIFLAAGYKVGAFIKPLFGESKDMIHLGGKTIKEDDFARIFGKFENDFKRYNLSRFEMETIIAFEFWNEEKVDVAIVECGMGGEKDATNIQNAAPLLSIVTSLSLEHTRFLGDSLPLIAKQKAGIMKAGRPLLISSRIPFIAKKVFYEEAAKKRCDVYEQKEVEAAAFLSPFYRFSYPPLLDLSILSPAYYEVLDACLALEATRILRLALPVREKDIRKALLLPSLPCRFERVGNVYLDGAHNPEAMEMMLLSGKDVLKGKDVHVLFAAYKDKDVTKELSLLKDAFKDVTLTSFASSRARGEKDYPKGENVFPFVSSFELALNSLLVEHPSDPILVTGSLEFAYRVRSYLLEVFHD